MKAFTENFLVFPEESVENLLENWSVFRPTEPSVFLMVSEKRIPSIRSIKIFALFAFMMEPIYLMTHL